MSRIASCRNLLFTLLLSLIGLPGTVNAAVRGTTCHLPGYSQPLRCVTIAVPQDYSQPLGAKLDLQVVIAPAFREAAKADPLFVLAGGPGQAGSDVLFLLDASFRQVRATRDIVIIDQRGTGLSGKLDCDSTRAMEGLDEVEQEKIIAACLKGLHRPFATYTTDSAARDMDAVRAALSYQQINVWGASYGTRLGQAYARRFPDHLRAMVLDGVASDEQIIFAWGSDAQAALDAVFKRCAAAPACHAAYPDLASQFATLLQRVKGGAVKLDFPHPRTAVHTSLVLRFDELVQTVRTALYAANSGTRLPFVIDSAYKGNWAPFLAMMYAPGDFSMGGMSAGLMLAVTCAEDIPRLTPAIVAAEERASFLAASEVKRFPPLCKYVDVPARINATPAKIDAPVLLLSGAWDPVTPPYRAEQAAKGMNHAHHLVVTNLGHGISTFGCAPRLLREFLDHPELAPVAQCLREIPTPGFQLGAAGPQP